MKRLHLVFAAVLGLLLLAAPMAAQTILTTTTLSSAVTTSDTTTIVVAATTGMTVQQTALFVPITGELMSITRISGTTVYVRRGANGTAPFPIATSATLVIMPVGSTVDIDPGGACVRGNGLARFSPIVNTANGNVWVCRSSTWNATNLRPVTYNSLAPFTP